MPPVPWGITRSTTVMRQEVRDWTISVSLAGAWVSAWRLVLARREAGDPVPALSSALLLLLTARLQKAPLQRLLQVVFTAPPGAHHQGPGWLDERLFQAGGQGGGQVRVILLQLLPMTTSCPLHFPATKLQSSPQLLITRGARAVLGGGGVQLSFDFSPNSTNCPGRWFAVAEFRGGGRACPEWGSQWAGDPVLALSLALFVGSLVSVPCCLWPKPSHLLSFPLLLCPVPPALLSASFFSLLQGPA